MPQYRRDRTPGGTYFFTVVTYQRRPLLVESAVRAALRAAIVSVRRRFPFNIDAFVLLPDHLHCAWTLPAGDAEYPLRWAAIKRQVSRSCPRQPCLAALAGRRREAGIWQRRFWEHRIRSSEDLRRHIDYTYWNPVKHGLVSRVGDWPYSTFHRDVVRGLYPPNWGAQADGFGGFGE